MLQADFDALYQKGRQHRHKYSTGNSQNPVAPLDAFFTRTRLLPPVIGFGLPKARLPHPLVVTVGINPSSEEFEGKPPPLPTTDDLATQWKAQTGYFVPSAENAPYVGWFALAARFLRASRLAPAPGPAPCSPYAEGHAVHLDLSPVVTSAFTKTLSREVKAAKARGDSARAALLEKRAAAMISDGVREILVPALSAIRSLNEVSCIVVFGLTVASGGTPVVNNALRRYLEKKAGPRTVGEAQVAWAIPLPSGILSGLGRIPFGLVSQGPSYWQSEGTPLAVIDQIGRACDLARP